MGLFRLFYRIGRMLFRDILFKIPKKYLVVIIVFLTIFILRSNVFASYEVGGYTLPDLPSDINNYNYFITYNFNSNGYTIFMTPKNVDPAYVTLYSGFNCIRIDPTWYGYNIASGATSWGNLITQNSIRRDSYVEGLNPDNAEREYQSINCKRIIDGNFNILYDYTTGKGGEIFYEASVAPFITNDLQDIQNWSFDYLLINGGTLKTSNQYGNNFFWLETIYNGNTTRIDIDSYYTTLNDTIYWTIPRNVLLTNNAIINGNDVQFNIIEQRSVEGGREYLTYNLDVVTFDITQQEQDNINEDKTQQALDNISNAQQNTNNFLMDNNFNEGDVNISSPTVSNQEAISGSDNFFSNYMTTFANLYNGSEVVTVDIYIPNYINNTGTKFITIRSDMIKNYLINNPIIPGTTFNIYNIIQVIWTALFGFWFVNIITKFVTSLYSGELMSDKALKELSSTYTNVTSSML